MYSHVYNTSPYQISFHSMAHQLQTLHRRLKNITHELHFVTEHSTKLLYSQKWTFSLHIVSHFYIATLSGASVIPNTFVLILCCHADCRKLRSMTLDQAEIAQISYAVWQKSVQFKRKHAVKQTHGTTMSQTSFFSGFEDG